MSIITEAGDEKSFKQKLEQRAEAYIEEHVSTSGAPFPLEGIHRTLCIKMMSAFACGEVVAALCDIAVLWRKAL